MRRPRNASERPTKQQILAYIEEAPGRIGKREIARAFHLHGSDRIWLKEILRELESDALLEELFAYQNDDEIIFEHKWEVGDLVMMDNRSITHARKDFPAGEPRMLRRTMVEGVEIEG